jgi:SnoaL-like domain
MSDRTEHLAGVTKLLADYATLLDARQAQPWSELFGSDGRLVLQDAEISGTDELIGFAERSPVGVHLPGIASIEEQADGTFAATSHFVFVNPTTRVTLAGAYHDQIVYEDKAFRFTRRQVEMRARIEH